MRRSRAHLLSLGCGAGQAVFTAGVQYSEGRLASRPSPLPQGFSERPGEGGESAGRVISLRVILWLMV